MNRQERAEYDAAVVEDVEFLLDTHAEPETIPERSGYPYSFSALDSLLRRNGRPELATRLMNSRQEARNAA